MESNNADSQNNAVVSVLATDTVGFSARLAENEDRTLELLKRDLKWFTEVCEHFGGKILKDTGDGLIICFSSPKQALSCATHLQKDLVNNWIEGDSADFLQHRFGIHEGQVYWYENDLIGEGVTISSLLMSIAEPNAIVVSAPVMEAVASSINNTVVRDIGKPVFKNISYPYQTYEIFSSRAVLETTSTAENYISQELPFGPKLTPANASRTTPSEQLRLRSRKRFSTVYYTQTIRLFKFHKVEPHVLNVKGHYPTIFAIVKQTAATFLPNLVESDIGKGILSLQSAAPAPILKPHPQDVITFSFYASGSSIVIQLNVPSRKKMENIALRIIQELTARPISPTSILKDKIPNPQITAPRHQPTR